MVTKRPNPPRIRYNRDDLKAVLRNLGEKRIEAALDEYEKRRAEGPDRPCQSVIYHGPGHQSSTYCQQTGDHDEHFAVLPSGGYTDWTDDDPYDRS